MAWLRVDSNFRNHPKFMRAGFWGTNAVMAAWELAKDRNYYDGNITKIWQADYITFWLQADKKYQKEICTGMSRAVAAGLVDERNGEFFIHDWEDFQRRAEDAARKQNQRLTEKMSGCVRSCPDVSDRVPKSPLQYNTIQDNTEQNKKIYTATPEGVALADFFRSELLKVFPGQRIRQSDAWNRSRIEWQKAADKLVHKDGHSLDECKSLITWTLNEAPVNKTTGFSWRSNIRSIPKLREKWDDLSALRDTMRGGNGSRYEIDPELAEHIKRIEREAKERSAEPDGLPF